MTNFREHDVDFQLKLNQQLFNIPYKLLLINEKSLINLINNYTNSIKDLTLKISNNLKKANTTTTNLNDLNILIDKIDFFEKNLKKIYNYDLIILKKLKKRFDFFNDLNNILLLSSSTNNLPFDKNNKLILWYQNLTNILISDYLIRNQPQLNNVTMPFQNKGTLFFNEIINNSSDYLSTDLLDLDILINSNKISNSIKNDYNLDLLINWIDDILITNSNSDILTDLIFQTRFQQFIEFLKDNNLNLAITCYQNYLSQFINNSNYFNELTLASGILIFITDIQLQNNLLNKDNLNSNSKNFNDLYNSLFHIPPKPTKKFNNNNNNNSFIINSTFNNENLNIYKPLLSNDRWSKLNDCFLKVYYSIYGLSINDPLLIYLSLGISSLKTKDCYSKTSLSNNNTINNSTEINSFINSNFLTNKCPICNNKNFKKISKHLPFAHHIKSILFDNPIILPNGNIYDKFKLKKLSLLLKKNGLINDLSDNLILDPVTGEKFLESDFTTVYPT